MYEIKTFICLVDGFRRSSRKRNTAGRYLVGAKTAKEAEKLLRAKIKFGSIKVYYVATKPENPMEYKQICFDPAVYGYREVMSALAPRPKN